MSIDTFWNPRSTSNIRNTRASMVTRTTPALQTQKIDSVLAGLVFEERMIAFFVTAMSKQHGLAS